MLEMGLKDNFLLVMCFNHDLEMFQCFCLQLLTREKYKCIALKRTRAE